MKYDKPFSSYEEQLEIMKNKYNLYYSDKDFALKILRTISYHTLVHTYRCIFTKDGKLEYNMDIVHLYNLYKFDRDFQNILFKYSIHVENSFKSKMAYLVAKNVSVDQKIYLKEKITKNINGKKIDTYNYCNSFAKRNKALNKTLYNLEKVYTKNVVDEPTEYYKKNKNNIPPWILFKNAKFTDIIDLYSFLKSKDKKEICQQYFREFWNLSDEKKLLKDSLTIMRKYRNKIAHNLEFSTSKFSNHALLIKEITKIPYVTNFITSNEFKKYNRGSDDILAMIISIFILLDDEVMRFEFIDELSLFFHVKKGNFDYEAIWRFYSEITNLPIDLDIKLKILHSKLNLQGDF